MNWIILTHSIDKNLNPYYICIDWYLRNWKPFQFKKTGSLSRGYDGYNSPGEPAAVDGINCYGLPVMILIVKGECICAEAAY